MSGFSSPFFGKRAIGGRRPQGDSLLINDPVAVGVINAHGHFISAQIGPNLAAGRRHLILMGLPQLDRNFETGRRFLHAAGDQG